MFFPIKLLFVDTDQEINDLAFIRHRPESLKNLCEKTAFSKREIQMIYRGFKEVGASWSVKLIYNLQGCPSGIVNFAKFKEIYSQYFPTGGKGDCQFVK